MGSAATRVTAPGVRGAVEIRGNLRLGETLARTPPAALTCGILHHDDIMTTVPPIDVRRGSIAGVAAALKG